MDRQFDKKTYKEYVPDYRKNVNQNPFMFDWVPWINAPQLNQNISIQL